MLKNNINLTCLSSPSTYRHMCSFLSAYVFLQYTKIWNFCNVFLNAEKFVNSKNESNVSIAEKHLLKNSYSSCPCLSFLKPAAIICAFIFIFYEFLIIIMKPLIYTFWRYSRLRFN